MAFISDENLLEEFENVEEKAEKAFKNIQFLYRDIMGISDAGGEGYNLPRSTVNEKSISVAKSESVERYVPSPKRKVGKTPVGKNVSCAQYQVVQPLVVREKKKERPAQNYWSRLQNGVTLPERGYRNPVEHGGSVPKSCSATIQTTSDNVEHQCPLKVTIPEPFQMTLREIQLRESKELAKHKLKEKWSKSVENELRKKIHARPVPGHVHLPLYRKIVETYEQKKVQRKQQTSQRLKDLLKPFNLSKKSDRKFFRSESMPNLSATKAEYRFKAKPVPENILSSHVSKSLKEKEFKRKMRIAERSQELLRMSSLPFSEKKPLARSSSMGSLNQENVTSAKKSVSYNLKSKTKNGVSRLEQKEIFEDWNNKVASVNQKQHNLKDAAVVNSMTKSKDFLVSQALPFYDLPVKMTTSAMLREKQTRAVLNERKINEEQKFDEEAKRNEEEKQLKKIWGPKFREVDPTFDMKKQIEEQLRSYRESRILRQQEYEKELEEMKLRVEKQPLLVERQSQVGKKTAKSSLFDANGKISDGDDTMSTASDAQSDDDTGKDSINS